MRRVRNLELNLAKLEQRSISKMPKQSSNVNPAPTNPAVGFVWLCEDGEKPQMLRWDGAAWVTFEKFRGGQGVA